MKKLRLVIFTFFALIPPILIGCGNVTNSRNLSPIFSTNKSTNGGEFSPETLLGIESEQGEYTCPKANNVTPKYDWDFDGSNRYRVCISQIANTKILIFGEPSEKEKSGSICVFPANIDRDGKVFVNIEANKSPMVQCGQSTEMGLAANFASSGNSAIFNAVFIVEHQNLDLMSKCLNPDPLKGGTNFYFCPAYSYGRIR